MRTKKWVLSLSSWSSSNAFWMAATPPSSARDRYSLSFNSTASRCSSRDEERNTYATMNRITELKMKIVEYQRVRRTPSLFRARLSNFKGIPHSSVGVDEFILKVAVHLIS